MVLLLDRLVQVLTRSVSQHRLPVVWFLVVVALLELPEEALPLLAAVLLLLHFLHWIL